MINIVIVMIVVVDYYGSKGESDIPFDVLWLSMLLMMMLVFIIINDGLMLLLCRHVE